MRDGGKEVELHTYTTWTKEMSHTFFMIPEAPASILAQNQIRGG